MTSPERNNPPGSPSLLGSFPSMPTRVLVLVGYFACVSALIAALAGTWAVYRHHVVVAHWPVVAANVEDCHLDRYQGLIQASRTSLAVRCRLAYGVGSVHYVSPVRSPFTLAGDDQLSAWIAAHPRGSTLLVHYDPRDPAQATLTGAGISAEGEAVSGPFRGALAFGGAGAILLLGAAAIDRRRQRYARGARRWRPSHLRTPPVPMGSVS